MGELCWAYVVQRACPVWRPGSWAPRHLTSLSLAPGCSLESPCRTDAQKHGHGEPFQQVPRQPVKHTPGALDQPPAASAPASSVETSWFSLGSAAPRWRGTRGYRQEVESGRKEREGLSVYLTTEVYLWKSTLCLWKPDPLPSKWSPSSFTSKSESQVV